MNFGQAVEILKTGGKVARSGWNGKGMWVRRVDLYTDSEFRIQEINPSIGTFMPFFVIFSFGNLNTWVPSISDVQAEDWEVVNL